MIILDLYSGLGGFSQAFEQRGHEVITVDIEEKFRPTYCASIYDLDPKDFTHVDAGLAGPPCNCFSQMAVSKNWEKIEKDGKIEFKPRRKEAEDALEMFKYTFQFFEEAGIEWYIVENPQSVIYQLYSLPTIGTATYCQYGTTYMKPEGFWGRWPYFKPRRCYNNDLCHEEAKRGSRSGIQGVKTAAERAKVPFKLSFELCRTLEYWKEHQNAMGQTTIRQYREE